MLVRCQDGYEELLLREVAAAGFSCTAKGVGWVLAEAREHLDSRDWCFAHAHLRHPIEIAGNSVNALAAAAAEIFFETARTERFDTAWPLLTTCAGGREGLSRRASAVSAAVLVLLKKRMARVARLATAEIPRVGVARGLFIHFHDFGRAFVSREIWSGGQKRMADDPKAPSRSYLKVEEAYGIVGCEPGSGELVADLGAAPGGWSYSAARRGARVVAIDNGPLKGGALGHPEIEHRREDAFVFQPEGSEVFDWLFCDLVEDPHHVLHAIVEPWIHRRWCRRFVVNLKFGRADAIDLLAETRQQLESACEQLAIRHLFHDREEFTVVGRLRCA